MKILICAYDESNKVGGPYTWLTRFVRSLKSKNIEVAVLFLLLGDKKKCINYQKLKNENFEIYARKLVTRVRYYDNTEDRIRWILKVVEQSNPSIFIPNLVVPALFASKWIKKKGIPTIGLVHSDDDFYKDLVSFFGQNTEFLSAIIGVSDKILDDINRIAHKDILKYKIPYLVPIPKNTSKYNRSCFRIAYSGRFENEQKRIKDVISTFALVSKAIDNVTCHLYGSGSQTGFVEDFIHKNSLQNKIFYEGSIQSDSLQNELAKNNVITLLSDYEGIPIAILEAMAVGLVPVCKYIESGLPEIIHNNQTGYLLKDYKNEYVNT
jgi:glycosyltransferase involved in cell wall biosynthesis